jgi:hypothetical protein
MHEMICSPDDILAIIERRARHIAIYCAQPTQDFSTDQLKRAVAAVYATVEELEKSLAKGKPANGQAEAN